MLEAREPYGPRGRRCTCSRYRAIEFTKFQLCTRDRFLVRASTASWETTLVVPCPCPPFPFIPLSLSLCLSFVLTSSAARNATLGVPILLGRFRIPAPDRTYATISIQMSRDCPAQFNIRRVLAVNALQLAGGSATRGVEYLCGRDRDK